MGGGASCRPQLTIFGILTMRGGGGGGRRRVGGRELGTQHGIYQVAS